MKRSFYTMILLFCLKICAAQQVSGTVFTKNDKGIKEALPGVNVFWQGTTIGVATDEDGKFHLPAPARLPASLVIAMMGFDNDTISIASVQTGMEIILSGSVNLKEISVEARQNSTMYSTFRPINTEVISGKELLKAACCNLSESFSTNASVDVAFTDAVSGAKKIQMLGLDGVYTQILSENLPMLRGLSASYGLNYIPGTWIENIMVTKGTGSVVNGYESISGQINLEFLKPTELKERLFINLYGSEKARAEANVHFGGKLGEKWSSLLFTHVSNQSLKQDMNKDSFLDMPLLSQYNAFNRWDFNNHKNFEAQFGIKGLHETRLAGQNDFNHKTDVGTMKAYGIGIHTRQIEGFAKTGFLFPSAPYKSIGVQTSGKYQQQNMYFGLREYLGEQTSMYANLIYADIIKTTDHKYKFGLSYLYDDYKESYNDSAFSRTENVPGVFAEYTYTHAENFSLVAGVREDYHLLHGAQFVPRLHLRYAPAEKTTLRLSAGKGFRVPNVFVEQSSVFASSRQVIFNEEILPEIAWNYGISANQSFKLFGQDAFINVDFFRTDFQNQLVVDLDQHVNKVVFYNLKGKSYSHSLQVDVGFEPLEKFAVKFAYKWYDVKATYNYELMDKPFIPKHRVMANISYATYMEIWRFDFTTNWLGESRIPSTLLSPVEYRLPARSSNYFLLQAQITKKFRKFEIYLGCENILNYTQKNAIVASHDPFGTNFDASMVYAPLDGRTTYLGLRMSIK